ncbi:hypothetical protein CYL31_14215 [Marinomonas sp. A3A]|nr:hypothetical protein CYL31_14215 [Marinomonas sp. A3A]
MDKLGTLIMNLTKGSKVVVVLAVLSIVLFLYMLYFRAFIYADMYIAPDEPYGISDIIELLLGSVFILLSLVSGVVSLALFIRGATQSKVWAVGLVVTHAIMYLSFVSMHALAASYGSA